MNEIKVAAWPEHFDPAEMKPKYLPAGPERDKVLEEAKNWTDEDLVIYDDAKVEEVEDGYYVEAYVWVAKEVSDENL